MKHNSCPLLRTLTKRSKIKFGQYREHRVEDMIVNRVDKRYLRWMYYSLEGVTFLDEILDELNITEKDRIKKHGKDTELFEKIKKEYFEKLPEEKKSKLKEDQAVRDFNHYKRFQRKDDFSFSKERMLRRNHGNQL